MSDLLASAELLLEETLRDVADIIKEIKVQREAVLLKATVEIRALRAELASLRAERDAVRAVVEAARAYRSISGRRDAVLTEGALFVALDDYKRRFPEGPA